MERIPYTTKEYKTLMRHHKPAPSKACPKCQGTGMVRLNELQDTDCLECGSTHKK